MFLNLLFTRWAFPPHKYICIMCVCIYIYDYLDVDVGVYVQGCIYIYPYVYPYFKQSCSALVKFDVSYKSKSQVKNSSRPLL